MSLISLDKWISCQNKEQSWESIFKALIDVSSSGTKYLRTNAGIYLATQTLSGTFTDADLQTVIIGGVSHEVLEVPHGFGTNSYDYVIKDNLGNTMIVAQSVIDTNSTYFIIDDTITGTWTYDLWTV